MVQEFEKLDALVRRIQETGLLLKDINMGLLDFPALKERREVYLCWQYGEGEIAFWHEVEAALEEESKNNRLVLFPIRLDDTVMNTRDDWAAKIKRRRHIGDFSNWQDEGSYRRAFERLLRDLRAE